MAKIRDKIISEAIIEVARRRRMALSATWRSLDKTSPATIKARRLGAEDSGWVKTTGLGHLYPRAGVGHAHNSLGGLRPRARDRVPPRSVVTDLAFPPPEPGRPMPGASLEAIQAWNLKVIAARENV